MIIKSVIFASKFQGKWSPTGVTALQCTNITSQTGGKLLDIGTFFIEMVSMLWCLAISACPISQTHQ